MTQYSKPSPGLNPAELNALDKDINYKDFLTLCPHYNIFADQRANARLPSHILTRLCWREMRRGKNCTLNNKQPHPELWRGHYQILTRENRLQGYGAINFKGNHAINLLLFNDFGFPSSLTLGFSDIVAIIYRPPTHSKKRFKK